MRHLPFGTMQTDKLITKRDNIFKNNNVILLDNLAKNLFSILINYFGPSWFYLQKSFLQMLAISKWENLYIFFCKCSHLRSASISLEQILVIVRHTNTCTFEVWAFTQKMHTNVCTWQVQYKLGW